MKNIVIIDDNIEITNILGNFFRRFEKVKVETFNDATLALRYLKTAKIDLVLSDITMPHTDGLEILQSLFHANSETNVVMMTADASLEKVLKSHRYNAKGFVIKPINFADLNQIAKNYL
ncbi:MAG: response regulator [Sulfurimonas sp.]|nr:response regulator [Sulfurimonas sp.]